MFITLSTVVVPKTWPQYCMCGFVVIMDINMLEFGDFKEAGLQIFRIFPQMF